MQALDRLEVAVSKSFIQRRYLLTHLVDHRNKLEGTQLSQRPERAAKTAKAMKGQRMLTNERSFGRASSLALENLMSQAYPGLKPTRGTQAGKNDAYQKKLKSIKNRLTYRRNWSMVQQRFSLGILALIPTGGDYRI
jgi:hypothetical protein